MASASCDAMTNAVAISPNVSPLLHVSSCEESDEDLTVMRHLIENYPDCINKVSTIETNNIRVELTPVMLAIRSGHLKCVKFLVENGATVELYPILGLDALNQAIQYNHESIVKYLLDIGMCPNDDQVRSYYFNLPVNRTEKYLGQAIGLDNADVIQALINAGAMVEDISYIKYTEDYTTPTPTTLATFLGCPNSLKTLLLNGAIVDYAKETEIELDCLNLALYFVLSYASSLETRLRIMYILHSFGVSFMKEINMLGYNPVSILENEYLLLEARSICNVPQNMPMVYSSNFSNAEKEILLSKMREISSKPMSLKSQARLCIVKVMGKRFISDVGKIPYLPREVYDFLSFHNV